MITIAEVKTESPFGWKSDRTWDELCEFACHVGDWVAVHTDPRWGGSFDLLGKARKLTPKLLVAKGIHGTDDEVRRAFESGADRVLVVGRIPGLLVEKCLIEPRTLDELKALPESMWAVWNDRDLGTGGKKAVSFREARSAFKGWLCQASFIKDKGDIYRSADAVLVGTHLREFVGLEGAQRG